MMVTIRALGKVALTLAGMLALPSVACAENQAETTSRWGLIGTWALDCSKPASENSPYLTYVIRRAGKVTYERDFGDRQDVSAVEEVNATANGELEVVVNFPSLKQTRRITWIMGRDGRARAVS